ncbi:hypothetical protein M2404_001039 [Rheinheimera pacifica]|uniref:hypothetical protein n=1 Tax=Rheinheimera pacifica TaxID=173990 RepID=UPI0021686C8D|nr:hypothetical protein [Rheinheimera pacifica]MCS4306716.1 hypothetical protein [Rheinheimera pacifica]
MAAKLYEWDELIPANFLDVLTLSFGLSSLNWLVSTIFFIRLSVIYIDKELERKGVGKPEWDGIGVRVGVYALAILSKWFAKTPMIAGPEVRTIARRMDYYLALWFQISLVLAIVSAVALYPFIPD